MQWTYSSLQLMIACNFKEIKNTFPASFEYVTNCSIAWFLGIDNFCLIRIHVHIFLLKWILVKFLFRAFQGLCAKTHSNSANDRYFLRFHNCICHMFVNLREGNCFFCFQIMLSNHVSMGWKFQGNLKSSILKHIFMYSNWHISYKLAKCI